jgi:hypothetical protein
MYNNLTILDYKNILNYYKIKIPKTKKLIVNEANKILSEKLCRCIKKIDTGLESRAIGICTRTIFNRKGLTRGKFNCTGKRSLEINKKNGSNKTRKNKH